MQVVGLDGKEGVYRVPARTNLKEFLRWVGIPADGVDTVGLQDWTCLDFQDSSGKLPPRVGPMRESVKYLLGQPMDLNRAGVRDLVILPGIGPGLAKRIVMERSRRGPFLSPSDLARVKGIPRKTLEGIKPFLVVATEASWPAREGRLR